MRPVDLGCLVAQVVTDLGMSSGQAGKTITFS